MMTARARSFLAKVKGYLKNKNSYSRWIRESEKRAWEIEMLPQNPKISVVIPVYNVPEFMMRACIESVRKQTYTNWELCLVDDCSTMPIVRQVLQSYEGQEKIKIHYRESNGHISRATNDGFAMASGEFVGLMDCDDVLAVNALYEVAKFLNAHPNCDYVYSDEDKLSEDGKKRKHPFFKPDWSPDTLMSYMYTGHFSVFRKSLLEELGGERIGFEGSQDYDLVLRVMEKTNHIGHIPKILYHWRMREESTASAMAAKPYVLDSTVKAKEEALARRGLKGKLEYLEAVGQYRVIYEVQDEPLVSIVIPSKDNYEMLATCIASIRKYTAYKQYEIIVVDNGSNAENRKKYQRLLDANLCKYRYEEAEFNFSRMCNKGASYAEGDYYLFLNDDIEIPQGQEEWLSILLGHAQLAHVGAVGAKLLYPGTTQIQCAGVLNLEVGPSHAFYQYNDTINHYWGRNVLDYNYTVLTGACILIQKEKYKQIAGFDEMLPVAYNDVELCFKLVENGYYNVLRNDVKLYHHESVSRGQDVEAEKAARLQREREQLYRKHPNFVNWDPCYNPNLTGENGSFRIRCN
ncbi:MAG: glycosyltransferase [Faecalimonas sp.]|nr:glycosyltransferase [Faecalimonas sp.]